MFRRIGRAMFFGLLSSLDVSEDRFFVGRCPDVSERER